MGQAVPNHLDRDVEGPRPRAGSLRSRRPREGSPPDARGIRILAGVSLLLAGILNGLPQYVTHLMDGDLMFPE
ncbi:MAG: hypothetical protein KY462_03890 [Actinobacteria bacterium]|nr:hypothetical protein [Actinomycetota bacterium]